MNVNTTHETPIVSNETDYAIREAEAVKAILDFYIDTRGCSRITACTYAIGALRDWRESVGEPR